MLAGLCEAARIVCGVATHDSTLVIIGLALFTAIVLMIIRDH